MEQTIIKNPHLEGGPFYWEGGPVGIVLLHGFTATTAEVRPLARVLHAEGYTVAAPLLPGHGTTPDELNRCRWSDWTGAAERTYRQVVERCRRVFVGGESMGALLALYLASERPEAAGVLTYAPALKVRSRVTPLLAPILAPFVRTRAKPQRHPSPSDDRWQGYAVHPVRASTQLFHLQRQVRRRLGRIQQPLLVVHGRLDQTVDPVAPAMLHQGVGSALKELHYLEDSGHCVILDAEWEQAASYTSNFIRRVLDNARQPG